MNPNRYFNKLKSDKTKTDKEVFVNRLSIESALSFEIQHTKETGKINMYDTKNESIFLH